MFGSKKEKDNESRFKNFLSSKYRPNQSDIPDPNEKVQNSEI